MESEEKQNFLREQINRNGRKESTTIGSDVYDVVALEDYLEQHPEIAEYKELSIDDRRLAESVSEGNKYWKDENGVRFGPSDFLNFWQEYKQTDESIDVDTCLEELKKVKPEWTHDINSLLHAKDNLDNPIWLMSDETKHPHPFNGMHRLTRAILDGRTSISVLIWNELPDEAILRKS